MKKLLNEWKKHLKEINEGVDPTCPDNVVEHAEDILHLLTPFGEGDGEVEWSTELKADFLEKFKAFIEEYKRKASEAAEAAKKAVEDSREDF
tara:strand:+ start:280 stop:555 length:276 start_codon:yes stop_codon:yes gene_type:complete